eukprot:NODE_1302_length_1198_cov_77.909487_g1071_i0.p1 GENE.NODE_1302_length_1198_cov_77.909487_g1071_i0~~NODE_1302_length_1198_cov_77.909487_g1071_i0.p1  ORF type:complete len:253 (-),score=64.74 NODE_1302_length_1198_cov_77.909487_g1071_i0:335-1093(-)
MCGECEADRTRRPCLDDLQAAAKRIAGQVHRTPVLTCSTLDKMLGPGKRRLHFKCENFQKVGAFKIRGALNAVAALVERHPKTRDVVTHSSGNHAQALALACKLRGLNAHVVMPETAPLVKKQAVEQTYGGRVYQCKANLRDREDTARRVMETVDAAFIHAFDNALVIAGQGTVGLELLEQIPDLDAVVVPVGGGGLAAGVTLAVKALRPQCRVFLAEPLGADDAHSRVRSAAQARQAQHHGRRAADHPRLP